MIRSLTLENYRSFDRYRLQDLARVSLLVGPNNCGKTSVLEAVQLLASGGDPRVLVESAKRRGEVSVAAHGESGKVVRYLLHHHFHGHGFGPGTSFSLSSDNNLGVSVEIVEASADGHSGTFESFTGSIEPLALRIRTASGKKSVDLRLAEDGSVVGGYPQIPSKSFVAARRRLPPVIFVTAESLHAREMADTWDEILMQGRESEVIEAMRILQEDLASIHFLASDAAARAGGPAGIVLGIQDSAPRVPIGSYGDGMRRILALSLSLVRAENGFLLVDEIDTGLHWTAMEAMWKLVVETAARASIQVFATTHSVDCIKGLARLLGARHDLRRQVSIQKLERRLPRSAALDADALVVADDLGIELR